MVTKLLSVVGAVAVLGALVATTVGLWLLEDRITLVVAATAPPGQPTVDALLREEVVSLRSQVEALQVALASNFESMGTALDERAAARHTASTELLAGLQRANDVQSATLRQQGDRLVAVAAQCDRLALTMAVAGAAAEPAQTPAASSAGSTPPPAAAAAEVPAPGVAVDPEAVEPPAVDPALAAAMPAKTPTAGRFLSFAMPAKTSPFAGQHEFVLLEELCRVGFDAKSTLHDFTGVTTKVTGTFQARLDDAAAPWSGQVRCAASALDTGLAGRDENLREHLAVDRFPAIEFTIGRAELGSVDVAAGRWQGVVHGTMTIRGTARELAMPVEITVDASQRLVLTGQAALRLSDYAVPVPSQLGGAISMQDEVKVWIALRARAKVGGVR
jgi:polyisoprenoid-binding protein YceI